MAELVAVGGAELVDAVGPDRAEVYHHKMDGTSFTEYFPWELTNTDYYRRVLAQVGYALQPLVEAEVKAHGVVDVDVRNIHVNVNKKSYFGSSKSLLMLRWILTSKVMSTLTSLAPLTSMSTSM